MQVARFISSVAAAIFWSVPLIAQPVATSEVQTHQLSPPPLALLLMGGTSAVGMATAMTTVVYSVEPGYGASGFRIVLGGAVAGVGVGAALGVAAQRALPGDASYALLAYSAGQSLTSTTFVFWSRRNRSVGSGAGCPSGSLQEPDGTHRFQAPATHTRMQSAPLCVRLRPDVALLLLTSSGVLS